VVHSLPAKDRPIGLPARCGSHWHGAAPTAAMTHIAIQEQLEGKVVDWMEKVSDKAVSGPR
jgi:hypothetical protein